MQLCWVDASGATRFMFEFQPIRCQLRALSRPRGMATFVVNSNDEDKVLRVSLHELREVLWRTMLFG